MKNKLVIIMLIVNILVLYKAFSLNRANSYQIKKTIIEGLTAPRGRILDIKGNILVDNKGVKSLIFNKLNINSSEILDITKTLANTIDIKENVSDYDLKYYY